nr:MAG TPA: hypothetical protein [Caudoviricetes sp.]
MEVSGLETRTNPTRISHAVYQIRGIGLQLDLGCDKSGVFLFTGVWLVLGLFSLGGCERLAGV